MDHRKTAPPLDLNYSTLDGKVNGHKSRCQALDKLWRQKYCIDYDLDEIHIVDYPVIINHNRYTKDRTSFDGEFVVEITDVDILSSSHVNVLVNYNIGAGDNRHVFSKLDRNAKLLLGERYFIADWRIKSLPNYGGSLAIIAPGGNKDSFLERIDVDYVASMFEKTFVAVGIDKLDFLTLMRSANVVITTPSTTAMEALAMGTPVLLIKTSHDQTGEFVRDGYAEWFSKSNLNKYAQKKIKTKRIPADNVVVDEIYNEWTKWRSE